MNCRRLVGLPRRTYATSVYRDTVVWGIRLCVRRRHTAGRRKRTSIVNYVPNENYKNPTLTVIDIGPECNKRPFIHAVFVRKQYDRGRDGGGCCETLVTSRSVWTRSIKVLDLIYSYRFDSERRLSCIKPLNRLQLPDERVSRAITPNNRSVFLIVIM